MANTSAIWHQLSSPSCSRRALQKSLTLKKYLRVFWKKVRRMDMTERAKGLGRKNRGDSKGESNDSPVIPDRKMTSDIPSLPSGHNIRMAKRGNNLVHSHPGHILSLTPWVKPMKYFYGVLPHFVMAYHQTNMSCRNFITSEDLVKTIVALTLKI